MNHDRVGAKPAVHENVSLLTQNWYDQISFSCSEERKIFNIFGNVQEIPLLRNKRRRCSINFRMADRTAAKYTQIMRALTKAMKFFTIFST